MWFKENKMKNETLAIVNLQDAKGKLNKLLTALLVLVTALEKIGLNQIQNTLISFSENVEDISDIIQEAINKIVYREK